MLRWSLYAGGAASIAAALAACAASDGSDAVATSGTPSTGAPAPTSTTRTPTTVTPTTAPATTAPATTVAVDPSRPWWMQGNFAPVADEVTTTALAVRGALPPELNGLYVRNGSNPANGDSPHWFFGDGMVHGVRLDHGAATMYHNRYVDTVMYQAGAAFGQGAPGGASNQSNVSAIWHGNRLLTSGEVGLPYELDPADVTTIGPHDFGGRLTGAFTAHPKIDPATGRMHSFGYGFVPPYLTYHVIEPDGTMSHVETIDLPNSVMMHDFAITETDAVFWDLPVVFDLELAARYIDDPSGGAFPYQWRPDAGARIGVMPLTGGGTVQWFEIDPCYVFHGINAFRRGSEVVVDVCRLDHVFVDGDVLGGEPSLRRWAMDTGSGAVTDTVLDMDRTGDLPSRDPRRVGRDYRYAYLAETRDNPATAEFGGLIKRDMASGDYEAWDTGPHTHSGEWLFIPADDGEDEGYLLSYVHDEAAGTSELVVLDATAVSRGPIARVQLPQRVPYGFHATWVPA